MQGEEIRKVETISAGVLFAMLLILAMVVICLYLPNSVSILVVLIHNNINDVVRISHYVSLILAFFGFILEWFPLTGLTLYSPEEKSSHASILLFRWLDPLFWKGFKSPLSREKIPNLPESFVVTNVLKGFNKKKSSNSLVKFDGESNVSFLDVQKSEDASDCQEKQKNVTLSLTKSFGGSFLIAALMKFVSDEICYSTNLKGFDNVCSRIWVWLW